tara:strand:+ start:8074 stop:8505 length:432 start_codon:yes stop_codon:yes gene_type:complete
MKKIFVKSFDQWVNMNEGFIPSKYSINSKFPEELEEYFEAVKEYVNSIPSPISRYDFETMIDRLIQNKDPEDIRRNGENGTNWNKLRMIFSFMQWFDEQSSKLASVKDQDNTLKDIEKKHDIKSDASINDLNIDLSRDQYLDN